jgi:hypothetical protein
MTRKRSSVDGVMSACIDDDDVDGFVAVTARFETSGATPLRCEAVRMARRTR